MYLSNLCGMWKSVRQKPQLVSLSALNLGHRLKHRYHIGIGNGRSHPPEVLSVFVTDRCNMRCKACHYANSDKPGYQLNSVGDMAHEIFQKMIDETPGNPIISFTGGEPLLHPQIGDFIVYAKDAERFCTLVTNGWMLSKHAEAICDAGLDILTVSLDGTLDTHNLIRGKRSFERLIDGVRLVLEQPQRPLVIVSMAISDINYRELVPTYELVRGLGVDGMNVNHLWMQPAGIVDSFNTQFSIFPVDQVNWKVQPEVIETELVANGLETIRRHNWGSKFLLSEAPYLNRDEITAWYQNPERRVKYESVRCGWVRFKVWPDGKVKPCRDWEVGDLCQQNVMEIWNGREYRKFREMLRTHKMFPICHRCCQIALR